MKRLTVNDILNVLDINDIQIDIINKIAPKIEDCFTSHDFIERFTKVYPQEYIIIQILHYCSEDPFKVAHSQIGRWLESNQGILSIAKIGEKDSKNVHGNLTQNGKWERI